MRVGRHDAISILGACLSLEIPILFSIHNFQFPISVRAIDMVSQNSLSGVAKVTHQDNKIGTGQVERILPAEHGNIDQVNYERIDSEVAKYAEATAEALHISEEEDRRLKRMINKRILPTMVITYFLQALDKGTMSFTSIMGIRNDIPILLHNSKVNLHFP